MAQTDDTKSDGMNTMDAATHNEESKQDAQPVQPTGAPEAMICNEDTEERKKKALSLLPSLKEELGDLATDVEDRQLLKFLHWKTDVDRAAGRFRSHIQWRKENPVLFDDPLLQSSKDDELYRLLRGNFIIAPDSLTAKNGAAVLVGRYVYDFISEKAILVGSYNGR